ncbi:MAG TPA: PAS domain S-box protein [Chryseosolibacter sp.]
MKFKDLSVKGKLGVILLAITLLALINFFAVMSFLAVQRSSAAVIDVAGRNRMLTQRLALLTLNAIHDKSVQPEVDEIIKNLNNSIHALRHGGIVSYLGNEREIASVPETLFALVDDCETEWSAYKNAIQTLDVNPGRADTAIITDSVSQQASALGTSQQEAFMKIDRSTKNLVATFNALVTELVKDSEKQQDALMTFFVVCLVLIIATTILAVWIINRFITSPLILLRQKIDGVGDGDIGVALEYHVTDDVGKAFQGLRRLVQNVQKAVTFAHEIGRGNFDFSFTPASERDELGKALISMRAKLQKVAADDKKRNWTTEGLAKFADILRTDHNDVSTLTNNVLSEIVKYMQANQGSLFIVNEDDPNNHYLELVACYAWNKKKFLTKKVAPGEGLVGQAWLEKELIYLKEVPEDYIEITSGLGTSTPRTIVIVPLKIEQQVFGILELASFNDVEAHERDFLTKLAENLASTISAAKINARTTALLGQAQQQAEELRAQEEEMRQNMEELQATQEEILRKTNEAESRFRAVNESGIASIEFNLDGTIIAANENFLTLMEYSAAEVVGKHHRMFVTPSLASSAEYKQFWQDLANGIPRPGQYERVTKSGRKVTIQGSYSIIRDVSGKPVRILKLANDITEFAKARSAEPAYAQ